MPNQFSHLPLPMLLQGRPKLNGGGKPSSATEQNKTNREEHGRRIKERSTELSRFWKEHWQSKTDHRLVQIRTGIPLLLEIDPESDIDFLRGLGFEIICEIEDGFIIVATSDIDMTRLNEKLDEFIANLSTKCNSPAKLYGLSNESDRLQRILSVDLYEDWSSLNPENTYIIDISISCCGDIKLPNRPEQNDDEDNCHYEQRIEKWKRRYTEAYMAWDEIKSKREDILKQFVEDHDGKILELADGIANISSLPDSFSARLKITGECLTDLVLNFPHIFEVTKSEEINMGEFAPHLTSTITDININPPTPDAPIVCVIDSGIQEAHQYLAQALIQYDSLSFIPDDPDVNDNVPNGGHGTRVAGAILYPSSIPTSGSYTLPSKIRNIRILNANNVIPLDIYPPALISSIVNKFSNEPPRPSKIYNHSIGSTAPCSLKHMTPWAAAIDNQVYDNNILFIQAAGNINHDVINSYLSAGYNYPNYLNEELCRISDPAHSLHALTVGSISHSDFETEDVVALGKRNELSAFSRSGPGIWDVIKPDVVEYGGTYALNKGNSTLTTPPEVCSELLRRSPEGPAFAKDAVGTSFSTPKVTHIAAAIERILPDASGLLYRALVAQSARWPKPIREINNDECLKLLRYMGYGIPNLEKATHNNEYRITLITQSNLEIGVHEAHIFNVPIPQELRSVGDEYDILIEITLSYSARPRRTRRYIKNYLSTWVDWNCSRIGENHNDFARRIFETGARVSDDGDFNWMLGDRVDRGTIDGFSRKKGTLQKDWCIIKSNQLTDAFCIAVRGHKGWGDLFKAKYSLVVSFEALNQDVHIYEPIRSMIEVENEVNTREIEITLDGE